MALDGKAIIKEEITDKDAYDAAAAAAAAVAVATTSTAASSASSSAAATTAAAISRRLKGEWSHGQPTFGACCQWEEGRVSASYIKAFNWDWDWNWEHKCSQATGTTIDGVNASSCVCACVSPALRPPPFSLFSPASFVCWNFVCIVTGQRAKERKS